MITATVAKDIADAVNNSGSIDPTIIDERYGTGNNIIDELNHVATWAARNGKYDGYLDISKFSDAAVNNAIDNLETLGYTVDRSRLGSYKEIVFSWV